MKARTTLALAALSLNVSMCSLRCIRMSVYLVASTRNYLIAIISFYALIICYRVTSVIAVALLYHVTRYYIVVTLFCQYLIPSSYFQHVTSKASSRDHGVISEMYKGLSRFFPVQILLKIIRRIGDWRLQLDLAAAFFVTSALAFRKRPERRFYFGEVCNLIRHIRLRLCLTKCPPKARSRARKSSNPEAGSSSGNQ